MLCLEILKQSQERRRLLYLWGAYNQDKVARNAL
jgi:hypothetical protein